MRILVAIASIMTLAGDFSPAYGAEGAGATLKSAILKGNASLVDTLIRKGADVNASFEPVSRNLRALNFSASNVSGKWVREIKGGYLLAVDTPLELAVSKGHTKIATRLLEAGAQDNKREALRLALESNREESVRALIRAQVKSGAGITRCKTNKSCLAYLTEPYEDAKTPLFIGMEKGKEKIINMLMAAGAEPKADKEWEAFFLKAVEAGDARRVKEVMGKGVPLNRAYKSGNIWATPVMMASGKGHASIVRSLIKAGVDVNHIPEPPKKKNGDSFPFRPPPAASALILASDKGHEDVVQVLLKAGADVNYTVPVSDGSFPPRRHSPEGTSSLIMAAGKGYEGIVRLLIKAGADVNQALPDLGFPHSSSISGASPLILAAGKGHEGVVRALIKAGADVNYKIPGSRMGVNSKSYGATALSAAVANKHKKIARMLKKAGARKTR